MALPSAIFCGNSEVKRASYAVCITSCGTSLKCPITTIFYPSTYISPYASSSALASLRNRGHRRDAEQRCIVFPAVLRAVSQWNPNDELLRMRHTFTGIHDGRMLSVRWEQNDQSLVHTSSVTLNATQTAPSMKIRRAPHPRLISQCHRRNTKDGFLRTPSWVNIEQAIPSKQKPMTGWEPQKIASLRLAYERRTRGQDLGAC